jgi:formylglycine-generating enzyme
VTVAEFRRFAEASGYRTDASKGLFRFIHHPGEYKAKDDVNWFKGVFGKDRPKSEETHPVLYVSWNDAVAYCQWLTKKTGKVFRLPTEAEWEYACRAGTTTPFNTRENLTTGQTNHKGGNPYFKHHKGVHRKNTVDVTHFVPNAWGVYNMHGNVWEWCSDWYSGSYYNECKSKGTVANPASPATGLVRVLRGGSWNCEARLCRSAYRYNARPSLRTNVIGFRLVCEQ